MNQIASIVRRHWLPLLAWNSLILAATISAAVYANMKVPLIWTADAQLSLPQTTDGLNANLGTLGMLETRGTNFSKEFNPLQIQLAILTSDIVIERAWAADPEKSSFSDPSSYKGLFKLTPQPESSLILVEARSKSPEVAYQRLTRLLQVYQLRLNELRHRDARARELFVQQDLERARINLHQAQTELTEFQRATGLSDVNEQIKGAIATINQLKSARATLIAQAQANQTQVQAAAAGLGISPQQAMNSLRLGENREYQALRAKVSELEANLALTRSKYRDDSPHVQSLLKQRQELLQQIDRQIATAIPGANASAIDTTLGGNGTRDSRLEIIAELIKNQTLSQGLQQQANQIQNQINKLNAEQNHITANQARYLELQRRYNIAEGVYQGIIAQTQQGKTNPFNVYPNVQIIDEPATIPVPKGPRVKLIVLGGVLAAILGSVAWILLLEKRNPLLKPKDLQQVEFPVLGSIPRLKHPAMEKNLTAEIAIEFQRLASIILMREQQCLMVTSATAGEGKTTVTLGLALALLNFGFRVLIVDGDIRQAEMSRRLGHTQTKKTANVKLTPVSICPGLDLLPAPAIAKNKTSEYCARGGFEDCLKSIKESGGYDYVLVDSPPVGLASETNLMSAVLRNVLFVVRSGTSNLYSVMDCLEQLMRHNAQILGLVVNGVESRTAGYRYYGHQRELLETEP